MYIYNSWIVDTVSRKERREKYHVTAFANDVSSPWNFCTRKTILARNGLKDEMLTRFLINNNSEVEKKGGASLSAT